MGHRRRTLTVTDTTTPSADHRGVFVFTEPWHVAHVPVRFVLTHFMGVVRIPRTPPRQLVGRSRSVCMVVTGAVLTLNYTKKEQKNQLR
ncbi:hypothetical protein BaRGS_00032852 [Batillaria attramentaria]|uniref:Uncharacterized protein n=1 Tax=Batillaria attramentaria TaxID=370345 RepID=A0ABD0JM13_9CAEN